MILVVTSPDAQSINMFVDFLQKKYLPDSIFVNVNGLLSEEFVTGIFNDALQRHPTMDVIFKHKTRKKLAPTKLPKAILDRADCVIGFDLYSTHCEVLKSFQGWTDSVVQAYHEYITLLNGGKG